MQATKSGDTLEDGAEKCVYGLTRQEEKVVWY